ncbi:putative protein NUCLEAR FUSION DEFECTIVE 2 [Iris pallida]|uniref:RNase III domain-containing protein n=1 Tax=Iris pallida TaxID=29817 RepID=A0AAX6DN16_IRIPA|nr:putative protein NUCLEAR FUSION DEFECTIVE 2 [Iris pallida]
MTMKAILFFLAVSAATATAVPNSNFSSSSSSFEAALETLQTKIGYKFESVDLLRRAVTHPSYSRDNYRTLSLLGLDAIRSSASLRLLGENLDASAKEMDSRVDSLAGVSACAAAGMSLGLHKLLRVSPKTDPAAPSSLAGAFRGLFGAVAVDSGKIDVAGGVFWKLHADQGFAAAAAVV